MSNTANVQHLNDLVILFIYFIYIYFSFFFFSYVSTNEHVKVVLKGTYEVLSWEAYLRSRK